jgi:NAD(P)H-dependent FMN reductase
MEVALMGQAVQAAAVLVETMPEKMPYQERQIQAAAVVVTATPTLQTTAAAAL